jgi:hypothetical protein
MARWKVAARLDGMLRPKQACGLRVSAPGFQAESPALAIIGTSDSSF